MFVPEIERQMGIEVYSTKATGIGGVIRSRVEDFVVEEVLVDGTVASSRGNLTQPPLGASPNRQQFLLSMLVKRNWDTFIAVKNIAKALGINQELIQIAGIKDAKAITAQHISIQGVTAEEVTALHLKDIELHPLGYLHTPLCPFYLLGNSFKINVNGKSGTEANTKNCIVEVFREIDANGGIPNFYGHQRFGTTRAITHLVGKAIVNGDFEEAAMVFLAKTSVHEHPESSKARAELQDTCNYKRALQGFPTQLRFERLMLAYLAENSGDFSGAFRRLPPKLLMLFVQAWQSYLFNRFLSARLKAGFSLDKAELGDYVVNVERSGLPMVKTGKIVDFSNLEEVNKSICAGKVRVALPIFGAKQKLSGGNMGDIERQILEEESVDSRGFRVSAMPEVNTKGELRSAICPVRSFSVGEVSPVSEETYLVPLEFMLLKGAYATVLLREIIKPTDPIASGF